MPNPVICGECERYTDGLCAPVKEKYGWTPVKYDQKPPENCPYKYSHCSTCGAPIHNGKCSDKDCITNIRR